MMLIEMERELRLSARGNPGAIGFRQQRTSPRAVAVLMAKVLREQTGPFTSMAGGCFREDEREQMAAALEAGQLDDVIAEIVAPEQSNP